MSKKESRARLPIQKKKKRLNTAQLTELFTRLDINGDNELDIEEFFNVVTKLNVTLDAEGDRDYLSQ